MSDWISDPLIVRKILRFFPFVFLLFIFSLSYRRNGSNSSPPQNVAHSKQYKVPLQDMGDVKSRG